MDDKIREQLCERFVDGESLLCMDGYDDCILGVCDRFGMEQVVAYDRTKVILSLMGQGMTEEEAEEYFGFNQIGAWVGERTPVFITLLEEPSASKEG